TPKQNPYSCARSTSIISRVGTGILPVINVADIPPSHGRDARATVELIRGFSRAGRLFAFATTLPFLAHFVAAGYPFIDPFNFLINDIADSIQETLVQ